MSEGGESRLSQLPAVLLATAGVLVDATFRSDAFRDRIWAQMILWLAASLQRVGGDATAVISALIHGTFFLSLISAAYQAFIVQCRWNTSGSNIQADFSRFLAPSMLLPLLYSWIYLNRAPSEMESAWFLCFCLFALSFTSLCGWRWTSLRKRRVRQELVGIPMVETMPVFSSSTRSLEENWTDWTPSEVLSWIQSLEGDEWSSVCSQLAPERIPGCVLDALTVSELRSMGLPYGQALCLVDKISEMTSQHPSSRRMNRYRDPQQDEIEVDEWFRDDGPRSSPERQRRVMFSNQPSDDSFKAPAADATVHPVAAKTMPGELNEEVIQKAKDLFREQFGLELPEIKMRPREASEMTTNDNAGTYSEDMPATLSEPTTMSRAAEVPQNLANSDFPKDLLDSMPPHVREVAEQQPDLVQMLWKQRQEGKSTSALGLSRIHQLRMQDPAYAQRFAGAQVAAEMTGIPVASEGRAASNIVGSGDDEMPGDQNSDDGERTGLLRKRTTRPPEYAAIR